MRLLDLLVILVYLVAVAAVGRPHPGRVRAAAVYMRGGFVSTYRYLGQRFAGGLQGLAAVTLPETRLLAEGVRLFASAIPIKLLLDAVGLPTGYVAIIAGLSLVTVPYTYAGGIRAVIWTDAIQMTLYVGGACVCLAVLLGVVGLGRLGQVHPTPDVAVLEGAR